MTFLCLSNVMINTAHIVSIQTEGPSYTIQTSRTYASQCGPAAAMGSLNYSYPEFFIIPKESADGGVIRSWIAYQLVQPWPNARETKQILRKQKQQAQKAQQQQGPKEPPQAQQGPKDFQPSPQPSPQELQSSPQEDVDALLHEATTKHEEILPRHASAALRRLNEHLRNSPGGSPSLSRSASPFRAFKASAPTPQ